MFVCLFVWSGVKKGWSCNSNNESGKKSLNLRQLQEHQTKINPVKSQKSKNQMGPWVGQRSCCETKNSPVCKFLRNTSPSLTKCLNKMLASFRWYWIRILPPLFGEIIEQPWWVTATCSRYCTTGWTDERSTMAKVSCFFKKLTCLTLLDLGAKLNTNSWRLTTWQPWDKWRFYSFSFLIITFTWLKNSIILSLFLRVCTSTLY